MKIKISIALLLLAPGAAVQAQVPISAQTAPPPAGAGGTQQFSYPSQPGSYSPPSTLRMTVTPGAAPMQPPPVRDTPESVRKYTECRDEADRASTSAAKMRDAVGQCLQELNDRRARGE